MAQPHIAHCNISACIIIPRFNVIVLVVKFAGNDFYSCPIRHSSVASTPHIKVKADLYEDLGERDKQRDLSVSPMYSSWYKSFLMQNGGE